MANCSIFKNHFTVILHEELDNPEHFFQYASVCHLKGNGNFQEVVHWSAPTPYLTFITPPSLYIRSAFALSCLGMAYLREGAVDITATSCKEKRDLWLRKIFNCPS